jgi:hypothetical protein
MLLVGLVLGETEMPVGADRHEAEQGRATYRPRQNSFPPPKAAFQNLFISPSLM